jgi:hypothetical protein
MNREPIERVYVESPVHPKNFELWCQQQGCTYRLNRDTFEYEPYDPAEGVFYRRRPLTEEERGRQ